MPWSLLAYSNFMIFKHGLRCIIQFDEFTIISVMNPIQTAYKNSLSIFLLSFIFVFMKYFMQVKCCKLNHKSICTSPVQIWPCMCCEFGPPIHEHPFKAWCQDINNPDKRLLIFSVLKVIVYLYSHRITRLNYCVISELSGMPDVCWHCECRQVCHVVVHMVFLCTWQLFVLT